MSHARERGGTDKGVTLREWWQEEEEEEEEVEEEEDDYKAEVTCSLRFFTLACLLVICLSSHPTRAVLVLVVGVGVVLLDTEGC